MNHLAPRQRKLSKKWDYTLKNKDCIYPIGYCHAYKPFDEKIFGKERAEIFNEISEKFKDKYHADGHDTKEEACQCYRKYLLDNSFKVVKCENPSTLHKCQVCGVFTSTIVQVGYGPCNIFNLCDSHSNRGEIEKLFSVSESFES